MGENTLFYLGYVILLLSTSLTLFSIIFNYDEDKPVKLSKWGWIAVGVALILALSNGIIEKAENDEKIIDDQKTDSLRNELIIKNDRLAEIIESFEEKTKKDFTVINKKVENNLDKLETVSSNIDNKFGGVLKSLKGTEKSINRKIYESNFLMPKKIKSTVSFGIEDKETIDELFSQLNTENRSLRELKEYRRLTKLKEYANIERDNPKYFFKKYKLNLTELLFNDVGLFIGLNKAVDINGYLEGRSKKIKFEYSITPQWESLTIILDFELNVSSEIYRTPIFEICKGNSTLSFSFYPENNSRKIFQNKLELYDVGLYAFDRELLFESIGEGAQNPFVRILKKENKFEYQANFNECWYEKIK